MTDYVLNVVFIKKAKTETIGRIMISPPIMTSKSIIKSLTFLLSHSFQVHFKIIADYFTTLNGALYLFKNFIMGRLSLSCEVMKLRRNDMSASARLKLRVVMVAEQKASLLFIVNNDHKKILL